MDSNERDRLRKASRIPKHNHIFEIPYKQQPRKMQGKGGKIQLFLFSLESSAIIIAFTK